MPPLKVDTLTAPVHGNTDSKDTRYVDFDTNVTELYEAISNSDWDGAYVALKKNPQEAQTWVVRYDDEDQIMWRFLPIHSACARQPPYSLIKALIKEYPEGVNERDDQGMYPLHYACGNQAALRVIRTLTQHGPDARNARCTANSMLPIHYLAQWGPSEIEVFDVLLENCHETLYLKDADGLTCFDLATEGDYAERENVIQLLETYHNDDNNTKMMEQHSIPMNVVEGLAEERVKEAAAANEESQGAEQRQEMEDEGRRESDTMSAMKEIMTLKAEVNRLRAEATFLEAETNETLSKELEAFNQTTSVLKERIEKAQKETNDIREETRRIDEAALEKEKLLGEKDYEFTQAQGYASKVKREIASQMEVIEQYEKNHNELEKRLDTLRNTMSTVAENQKHMSSSMSNQFAHFKKVTETRQMKLQELIDQEVLLEKESMEKAQTKAGGMRLSHLIEEQQETIDTAISTLNK